MAKWIEKPPCERCILIYGEESPPCSTCMPIQLMEQNRDAFEVVQYYLPSVRWIESKADGLTRPEYSVEKIDSVMRRLGIESAREFRKVSGCLWGITKG